MHLLLAAGFMLYFFHVPSKSTVSTVPELVASSTQVNIPHKIAQLNSSIVEASA